jgi:tryptophanyl-tRNA synthetase
MPEALNPWSNGQAIDTRRLFDDFGIEPIGPLLDLLPEVPAFMRRGIIVGHRDYRPIAEAIRDRRPFHILTGFMPSGHPHLGHLLVMREVVWHAKQGGHAMISIADREAHAVRGLSWDDCDRYGREYLTALYALGYTGEAYFQSKNGPLKDLAFEAATRVNFSELTAIYGFGPEATLAHAMSVITQVADILFPQAAGEPAPTVVPVGLDQDPHIRLTRDVANDLRFFTVEDRKDHVSVRAKNAPAGALEAVAEAYPGSKRYEGARRCPGREIRRRGRSRPPGRAGVRRLRLLSAVGDLPHVHARPARGQDVLVGPRVPLRLCRAVGGGQEEGDGGADGRPDHARGAAAPRRRARTLHALRAEPVPHVRRR